ncbi:hypothetical protein FEM48_Zijuj09G0065300 [Ziziphus jujuba var. spinosa]|uniref:Uncharacterized protein n=1 Tax=Ziziphus jujuba var. spinosa TaxID=714518 RepID=A0A978URE2_ZIZJJ|nr:hypothetical protein FEM48_Zijuj09G0065300 [Ziziphus jujuba var. spinosa]
MGLYSFQFIRQVYPRLKVRAYEQEDCLSPRDVRKAGLLSIITTESPSIEAQAGSGSPPDFVAKEIEIRSPPSIARIMKTYLQDSTIPSISPSKGTVKNKKLVKENAKPNINRACNSVPRPRAVLSSPDNDGMIGSRNKLIHERCSTLKVRKTGDGISVRSKLTPSDDVIKAEMTLNLKNNLAKSPESESEKAFKNRKIQEPLVRSQKTRHGIGK